MPEPTPAERPFLPRRFVPLIILLLVSGFLSLFVQDFFNQVIFLPILRFFRYYYRLYLGLPQNLVWAVAVLLAFFVAVRRLWPRFVKEPPPQTQERPQNRLRQLADLHAQALTSEYVRWELAQELEALTVALLQWEYGETAVAIQQRIDQGDITLPAELQPVFAACRAIPNYRSFIAQRQNGSRLTARFVPQKPLPALANLDLDAALRALEAWTVQPWAQGELS